MINTRSSKKETKNPKVPKEKTEKQKLGAIGEDCACKYLEKKGYRVVARNYLKKWGEIDIVTTKGKKIHFIEVKSVSREIDSVIGKSVIRETNDGYRPEDNMHPWKLQRLSRVIQSYLLEKDISDDVDWQLDLATVYVDMDKRISRVLLLEDIVL
jgi:putative endonuclease